MQNFMQNHMQNHMQHHFKTSRFLRSIHAAAAPSATLATAAALALACLTLAAPLAASAADTTPIAEVAASPDRLGLAREAIAAKDWKKALTELNLALKDQPKNADVHNLLGYSYRKQAQPNLPKSFEHYKIALQINPKHKGAHEYIGEAYLMDKKPEEAEKHLALLEKICTKKCEEYQDLAKSLADYKAKKTNSTY